MDRVQPLLVTYAVCTVILILKQRFSIVWGADWSNKPEEDELFGISPPIPKDIKRRNRIIMNDMENLPLDLVLFWGGFIAVLTGSLGGACRDEALALNVLLPVYTFARLFHTICYQCAWQPYRTLSYLLGMVAVLCACGVLISAAARTAML